MPLFSAFRLVTAVTVCVPLARAVSATGLSSFEALEEPLVKFFPATDTFAPDAFVNITDLGGGTFRMAARFNAGWWDGDRDTQNKDRQRVEVKGLGPHQRHGETFEYATTWRTNPGFRASGGFCHLFQLKAINGDSGAPLITLSLRGDKATVEANPAGPKTIAREFPWRPDTWQTVRIRVKTSPDADGELLVSVDGDAFQGKTGVALTRPDADEYRPKWGLYRRAATTAPLGDDFAEHKAVSAQRIGAPVIDNDALELHARELARTASPEQALAWLQAQPASAGRDFALGSLAALRAEADPAGAMAWAWALPPGVLRADAILRVFARWSDRDVAAAAAWLQSRAPARELDLMAWLLATDTTYRYVNRPVALAAAALIADPALRAAAFDHVVLIWARQNPADAAQFVETAPALTAAQQQAIIAKIRARPTGRSN